jgi:cobalt/nickel transport system permease protein
MLALSTALVMQALFFGDGGITTLGANCFNMAIVGSLVAYLVCRVVAGRAEAASSRRTIAAAIAGYAAINASALLTACELGIQPLFFKDSGGAPLYAPYPLHIAIPAMMIGHLSFAGIAEFVVSGGVVAYLQRSNPSLLENSAFAGGNNSDNDKLAPLAESRSTWRLAGPLWIRLTLLMLLTPIGILAAGTAWGEWSASDFSNHEMRQKIASASGNVAPPTAQPQGLQRLSSLWSAPFPQYAPPFVRQPAFGYVMSAMFGSGLILGIFLLLGWLFLSPDRAVARGSP